MNDTTIKFKPGIPPKGPDRTRAFYIGGLVLLIGLAASILGVLLGAHPGLAGTVVNGLLYLLLAAALLSLLNRVQILEQAHQRSTLPGPLQMIVDDAKAAARAAGHDETHAEAVAQEVLTTCIRRSGGWRADP